MKKLQDLIKERYIMYWWGAGGDYAARKATLRSYKKHIDKLERYCWSLERDLKKDDEDIANALAQAKS